MAKESEERRLWIGNLDPRINEYHLLKLVQKYGEIEKFDLLFHRNGPLAGLPRGYAFVTYVNKEDAVRAKNLHNKLVGSKNVTVTWAHSIPTDEQEKPKKPELHIPALALAKTEKKTDREIQIQAIEAKLKLMEKQDTKDIEINKTVATERLAIAQYQYNKNGSGNSNANTTTTTGTKYRGGGTKRHDRHSKKPYDKYKNWR